MQFEEKYQILKIIGQGANAVVYLVRERKLEVLRAAKMISRQHFRQICGQGGGYLQEVDFLKSLDHPLIPRVIEIFEQEEFLCIIMDYVEGKNLRAILNRDKRIPEKYVLEIVRQLCQVLDYLHGQRRPVIYGDLKPENIVWRKSGSICLLDFGTACRIRRYGGGYISSGTPGYAAPEVVEGILPADTKADIYGLGATVYALLTGRDYDSGDWRRWQKLRRYAAKPLCRIVKKCLRKNPNKRWKSVRQIQWKIDRMILHFDFFAAKL